MNKRITVSCEDGTAFEIEGGKLFVSYPHTPRRELCDLSVQDAHDLARAFGEAAATSKRIEEESIVQKQLREHPITLLDLCVRSVITEEER